MPSLLVPSVCFHRNPQLKPGLDALLVFLLERDYTSAARWAIYDHVAVNGTLAGSPYLDPADEAGAESIFCEALPDVDPASDSWNRDESVYLDAEMLARGAHPLPFGPEPDAEDLVIGPLPATLRPFLLPPVCGGSEEAGPFEPSQSDLDWWAAQLECREAHEWWESLPTDPFGDCAAPSGSMD